MGRPRKPADARVVRITCYVKPEEAAALAKKAGAEKLAPFCSRILARLATK